VLCHVEKKFAKHIGPEEFIQCSTNLIKDETGYDVPPPHPLQATPNSIIASSSAASSSSASTSDASQKKKTCNLESYFEWSNRLRLLVANEILQVIKWIRMYEQRDLFISFGLKVSKIFLHTRKSFHKSYEADFSNI
jgi:hypothetical protein